jgi:hypothetical protein
LEDYLGRKKRNKMKEAMRTRCSTCPISTESCPAPKERRWKDGWELTAPEKDCPILQAIGKICNLK